jgi:mannose-6-phosphate isomerase-like protein (cupin superfamily)
MSTLPKPQYQIVNFAEIPGVSCPCGTAKRAFAAVEDYPATIHQTQISADARKHYHLHQTEAYYFLECEEHAQLELDDELLPVAPGMCVLIPPGVRHRAIGKMTILNIVIPKFDPADEHFD